MRFAIHQRTTLVILVCLAGDPAEAFGGSLRPNPASTTTPPQGITNVSPAGRLSFYRFGHTCPGGFHRERKPSLAPAGPLSAQGFAVANSSSPRGYTGANGWTINFAELTGHFTRQVWLTPGLTGLRSTPSTG